MNEGIKSLEKRGAKRFVLWLVYLIFAFMWNVNNVDNFYSGAGLSLIALSVFTVIDEKIKEGYFFDPKDLKGKGWTHEKLVFWSAVFGAVLLMIGGV